jgi:flagellar basal body-associated protein FliL
MQQLWIGILVGLVLGAAVAAGIAFYYYRSRLKPETESIYAQANADISARKTKAEAETAQMLSEAREEVKQLRLEAEQAIDRRFKDIARTEERLDRRQTNFR